MATQLVTLSSNAEVYNDEQPQSTKKYLLYLVLAFFILTKLYRITTTRSTVASWVATSTDEILNNDYKQLPSDSYNRSPRLSPYHKDTLEPGDYSQIRSKMHRRAGSARKKAAL